jgi:ribosomal protein S12 methylthiotransferase accessory factor
MLARPRFKPHLRVATVPEEGVFVLSGAKQAILRGRLYELVVPYVDGRSPDDICDLLRPHVSPAEVYFTLSQLERKELLHDADDSAPLPADEAEWWSRQDIDPQKAARRLLERTVGLQAFDVDVEPLRTALALAGVRCSDNGELLVVVAGTCLHPGLAQVNDQALATGRPWLLVKPGGPEVWLGPLFRPGETGCWNCLAERLRSHRAVETYLHDRQSLAQPLVDDSAGTSATRQVAFGLIAGAIAGWIARGDAPELAGKIRTFDQIIWQTKSHTLVRLPFCRACQDQTAHLGNGTSEQSPAGFEGASGNGIARNFTPLVLEPRKKTAVRDGGHRVVDPQSTLDRYGHHISPITGAVSMLERISPAGDSAMHVYLAGHNLARRHRNLGHLRGDLRNMSAGKGTTDVQARASGLCEGLERYSGVYRGDERRSSGRLDDFDGAAIDVRECLLFSDRQYAERDKTNALHSMYSFVPRNFDPQAVIDWSPLWSLSRQTVRYLPTAFCYYDVPHAAEESFCVACSNGCAAGNTIEEAILQGFFELVERDSVALWWYNRLRRPGVDLESFQEPYLEQMARSMAAQKREMRVLDLTSDLGLPVFVAWSRLATETPEQIVLGFGAHLDARIALLRAVTEMNQMLSHLHYSPIDRIQGAVDDPETVHWLRTATAENQPYLRPAGDVSARTLSDFHRNGTDDISDDIRICQNLVERQGLEMLVLDQTRPEIGLPVVKVVVPGLRHFWTRFAAGRLYDVPVRLGWRETALAEEELNPIPMFL